MSMLKTQISNMLAGPIHNALDALISPTPGEPYTDTVKYTSGIIVHLRKIKGVKKPERIALAKYDRANYSPVFYIIDADKMNVHERRRFTKVMSEYGASIEGIAAALGVTEATVRNYLKDKKTYFIGVQ
jgi:ribosomal protein L33